MDTLSDTANRTVYVLGVETFDADHVHEWLPICPETGEWDLICTLCYGEAR